jgi:hypothetical protein
MPDVQHSAGQYRMGKMFFAAFGNFKCSAGYKNSFFIVKKTHIAVVTVNDEFIIGKNQVAVW